MGVLLYAGLALSGYLLGSIPTGFLVARARGIDIRKVGSGNIGATNVLRTLGKAAGTGVLLADAAKGALATWGLPQLARQVAGASMTGHAETAAMVAGIAAILGHNYTCWLQFKGGKGIATSAGVLAVLIPAAFGVCLAVWGLTFVLSRYVSLASIVAALALPAAVWLLRGSPTMIGVAGVLCVLAVYKHKTNLQRLLNGTEHRFTRNPREPSPPPA